MAQSDELGAKIEGAGLETQEYDTRWGNYRLVLTKDDVTSKSTVLKEYARSAYERKSSL